MPSHVRVVDVVEARGRALDSPVILKVRDDAVVEAYVASDSGLEEFAGKLEDLRVPQAKLDALLGAVRRRVREKPVSRNSLTWLAALDRVGKLK